MDSSNRRPQLPALSYLDIDKIKREEEAYQTRNTGATQTLPPVTAASPTLQYPLGPPPPYQPAPSQHANLWNGAQAGVHTSSESRQPSGGEQETAKQMARQSLPSLSEALGVDSQTSYSTTNPTQPAPQPAPVSLPPSAALSSPSATKRSYAMDPPQAQSSFANHAQSYSQYRQEPPPQHSYAPQEPPRSTYMTSQDRAPLNPQTSQPAPSQLASSQSYPPHTSTHHEYSSSRSSGSMGPPSFTYGYAPYPPRYAQPTPPSSVSAGPIYEPSANYNAPPTPTSSWKSDSAPARYGPDGINGHYADSLKRHLDMYDFEAALNDVARNCGLVSDFTRRYGDRLHQTARSGPSLATLPSVVEVDDMIAKSRCQLESLAKIRDVILTQQAAYEQQAADARLQHKVFTETTPPPQDAQDTDDSKTGFAGSDTKKRRGRAAPPGRCHSCNRAETPEWRRGPDGARTLCNACGLHYAKLTRKQNGASKNATTAGSSNLRPKEAAP